MLRAGGRFHAQFGWFGNLVGRPYLTARVGFPMFPAQRNADSAPTWRGFGG